jgi:peptidoglycan/LPS O-acetylase OafA/YrhL
VMVLTAHVYAPGWRELQGGYGVIVFFVLSGFLITQLLLREEHDTGGISFFSFYVRRAFRLFPIYYLILSVYCVLIFVLGLRPDGRAGFADALPWYLSYMQDVPYFRDRTHSGGSISVPFYQSWSLGIEEKFYLVCPVVAFRVLRGHKARVALAIGAVLLFSAARFAPMGRYVYPYAAISWGCLFALLYDTVSIRDSFNGWISSWRACVVLLTWPLLHVVSAWNLLPVTARLIAELTYPISIAFVILASLRSAGLARIFSFTPLVALGRYSYCIYLIHLLVRQAVERVLHRMGIVVENGLLVYLLMLLASTAAASILYQLIESRFREMGRGVARSWSGKGSASTCSNPAALDTSDLESIAQKEVTNCV